jgi:hypothetical protein
MRIFLAIGISLCMLVSGAQGQTSKEQTIRIVRSASQPSRQGPVENFTGSVRVDPLFQATLVHLPEIGIRGNTHFPMSDLNNLQIADQLSKFLTEKKLD